MNFKTYHFWYTYKKQLKGNRIFMGIDSLGCYTSFSVHSNFC